MRRWIALGVAAVGVAWGPYLYSEWAAKSARSAHAQPGDAPEASTEAPRESQLSAAADRGHELHPQPPPRPPEPEAEPAARAQPEPAAEPAAVSSETLEQRFGHVFEDEPRDAFWAVDEEPRLRALVQSVGMEPNTVSDVACRKTVCRVAFSAPDLDAELAGKLTSGAREKFAELSLDTHDASSDQHATLYVLRAGYVLEPTRAPAITRAPR